MEAFYFGKSPRALFGVYHPPQDEKNRNAAVVLCYPMGHEYVHSHRAFLRLAILLSSVGFHVLRFDFYGCGDSEGESDEGDIRQWVEDISTAVEEIKGGCDVDRICLVGLRLGASLSMLAGIEQGGLDSMVFWDPVISGKSYTEELTALHNDFIQNSVCKPQGSLQGARQLEILGFPVPDALLKDLKKLDLLTFQKSPANNIFLIKSSQITDDSRFRKHLKGICTHLDYKYLPAPEVWLKRGGDLGTGLVPMQILQSMVSWISEVLV